MFLPNHAKDISDHLFSFWLEQAKYFMLCYCIILSTSYSNLQPINGY